MDIKEYFIASCEAYIEQRILKLEQAIDDLKDALKLETKCSMGDKYETSRAMLHLEFEKLSLQYEEYRKIRKTLRIIDPKTSVDEVKFGSVVKTTGNNYFISVPVGELLFQGEKYFAIGARSPIAQALKGKNAGDHLTFNGADFTITQVY